MDFMVYKFLLTDKLTIIVILVDFRIFLRKKYHLTFFKISQIFLLRHFTPDSNKWMLELICVKNPVRLEKFQEIGIRTYTQIALKKFVRCWAFS